MVALRNSTRLDSERLKAPSYKALKRKVSEIEPYACCRARYGQRVAAIKFRVAGAGVQTARPLARAAMDHSRMDIFVVDEVSRLPLGRPWLTIIIDEHTRYILGYYLSFEDPSNVSMTLALRHALAPKDPSPDVKSTWDAWGVMETLVVDNGMEFHSCALEAGAGRFGITVQFCPRRKPWFKGKVERFFGTLNTGLLVDMHGKTFSNLVLKGDYDPAKHAVMTLATLRRVLHIWVVDVYHQDDHSALGTTPHEAWLAGLPQVDRYLPPSSVAMDAAFSKSVKRTLTHKGIEFDTLLYNSTELGKLRELHGSEIEVEIRTYDDDIGSLVVVFPDGKTLLKVAAIDSEYAAGLTRWQHRVCKRFQRRTEEDDGRLISLLEARKRIRSLIEQDMQLTSRKTRKQQQRFLQKTTDATSPNTEPPPALASSLGNSEMPASETAVSATPTHSSPVDEPITDASQAPVAVSAPVASTPVTPLIDVPAPAPEACATDADADDVDDVPTFRSRKVTYGKNHER